VDLEQRYRHIAHLWASQQWEAWITTTAPGYRFDPGVGPERDVAATLDWSRGLFTAFPDLTQHVEHVVVSGRTVVGVAMVRGTLSGPLDLGLGNVLSPTGRTFELPYVKVVRFDDRGRVLDDRQYLDGARMLEQITA
jgi:ketosteroid isomerase-like protein